MVPPPLEVETCEGAAWVGLVPLVTEVRLGAPRTRFPETNVRTYVRGPDGRPGVWFFSLDAARSLAVAGARLAYRLPYMWSRMRVQRDGARVRYESRREWPDRGRGSAIELETGESRPAL